MNQTSRKGYSLMWKRFMSLGIRTKLIVMVYVSVLLLLAVVTAVLLSLFGRYSRDQLLDSRMETARQIEAGIAAQQQTAANLANYFSIDPSVQRMLHQSNSGHVMELTSDTMRHIVTYFNVTSVVFYNARGDVVNYIATDGSAVAMPQLPEDISRPFARLLRAGGASEWEYLATSDHDQFQVNNLPRLVLWRVIKDINTLRPLGGISISLDSRKLAEDYDTSQGTVAILDHDGRDMLHLSDNGIYPTGEMLAFRSLATEDAGYFTTTTEAKGEVIGVYTYLRDTDMLVLLLSPAASFSLGMQGMTAYIIAAITALVLLILPMLLFVSGVLMRPIQRLKESMLRFSKGDFDTSVSFQYDDEIGVLGRVFNTMVQENRHLIETTYLSELREREAELRALQAQINPHFLYNLINTIHWNALRKGDTEIADIAYSMGRIFHITLSRGNSIIPLGQEKELVEYYLKLQKMRYKARLTYDVQFSEASLDARVPKLLIQPLVENSIIHGAQEDGTPLHIVVAVSVAADGLLHIVVADDGTGIPPQTLALLPSNLPQDETNQHSNRYALKNIHDRLQLSYGGRATLTIDSKFGSGTTITIRMPMTKEEAP